METFCRSTLVSITTDIEGIIPGNLEWAKPEFSVLHGMVKASLCSHQTGPIPVAKNAVTNLAMTVSDNVITADSLGSLGECDELLSSEI